MPDSKSSTSLTARVPNRAAEELRALAARQGVTVSHLIAQALVERLPELRSAASADAVRALGVGPARFRQLP
jgi:hypothetical protein